MCWIVKNNIFENLPIELTERVIRKYFPHCEACPAASMAQQAKPGSTTPHKVFTPGEEFQIDIKVFADNSKAKKHKRAIGGYTCALTAIDLCTGYKLGWLLKSQSKLEKILDELLLEVHSKSRTLKVVRMDNQFVTAPIKK